MNGYWWVSPLAIFLSAILGAMVALFAVLKQREIARVRATLDVILKSESDEFYKSIHNCFRSELVRAGGLDSLVDAKSESELKSRADVLDFLNHYELIAVSIDRKILDETFYRCWMRSTYIRHFEESFSFIDKMRKAKNAPLFCEYFENLVVKWKREGNIRINDQQKLLTQNKGRLGSDRKEHHKGNG